MAEGWLERWQEGRIGWHQAAGNESLKKHWRASGHRVLVPMCGKTQDLVWLAERGNEVIGVELSELAVAAFFEEQQLAFKIQDGRLPAYRALEKSITIYCGDFFEFDEVQCSAHYDRGALVAMPAETRGAYARHVSGLLNAKPEQLVITLEYDQSVAAGPPFSVPAGEVLSYWPGLTRIGAHDDLANGPPKFRDAGMQEMTEVIWRTP